MSYVPRRYLKCVQFVESDGRSQLIYQTILFQPQEFQFLPNTSLEKRSIPLHRNAPGAGGNAPSAVGVAPWRRPTRSGRPSRPARHWSPVRRPARLGAWGSRGSGRRLMSGSFVVLAAPAGRFSQFFLRLFPLSRSDLATPRHGENAVVNRRPPSGKSARRACRSPTMLARAVAVTYCCLIVSRHAA